MPIPFRRANRRLAAYQQELMQTHYQEMENMYRQMRAWRHDYRGHIQTMKALAETGDLAALRAYLDELEAGLTALDLAVKTGNVMADAILNSKLSLARAQNIPVRIDAHIPVRLSISGVDLCCVLGNLFDNAIEASLALPEEQRLIRVYMDMKASGLYLSVTNFTAGGKRKKTGGRFRSTKGAGHGLGLAQMDAIVRRMGGYLSRNSEDGAFTTEILLPQEPGCSSSPV